MSFSENAKIVLERRYLAKDENGKVIETIPEMLRRVADTVAQADAAYGASPEQIKALSDTFYSAMEAREFMPNSPTLMNAGRPLGQLSACFVLPVEDSMDGIFDTVKNAALIHKSGGGTGFSFSRLRPAGSAVRSTGGIASGPVSFMKVFDAATEAVKQGGTRRGANMGMLRVDHPDILEFIDCKKDLHTLNNFNISVAITDAFMDALKKGGDYALFDPHTKKETGRLDAKMVFDRIVDAAWRNGEPGVIFIDRMNADNPTPHLGKIESTNPCGEQPLLPYEACNLGSINLAMCVQNGTIDVSKIKRLTRMAVHFLDNVIDVNQYPLPEIDAMTRKTRKIGLGIMGFADMLLQLNVPYNSDEAVATAESVMKVIRDIAYAESGRLADERGNYPGIYEGEGPVYDLERFRKRNATLTTIAPTGTISLICDASSGCEPVFAYAFTKNVMDNDHLVVGNPLLEDRLKRAGVYSQELMRKILEQGSLQHIDEIPDEIKKVYVCAHDITPEWHIRIQAAFQRYTDNAVSKTINFTNEATHEDVRQAYMLAYELGCKGTTVYRDGSRDSQVLTTKKTKNQAAQNTPQQAVESKDPGALSLTLPTGEILPRPRPEVVSGITKKVKIGCGSLFITINSDEHGVCEVFTSTGRNGGCPSQSEAVARLTSVALRSGVAMTEILSQLKGIRCPSTIRQPGMGCTSCPDAIARTIEDVLRTQGKIPAVPPKEKAGGKEPVDLAMMDDNAICPDCGKKLRHEGGCVICDCGFSHCG